MFFGTQALCATPLTLKLSLTSFGIVTCVEPLKAAGFPAPPPMAGGGILKSLIEPSSKPPFMIKKIYTFYITFSKEINVLTLNRFINQEVVIL